ncbi:MAG: amino acid adenylation domain-containing protein [Thermoanaerobaculia bacterium]|nr:amino acid adenylation domain-containing protein [Thermoanaerobaculia bacterium]
MCSQPVRVATRVTGLSEQTSEAAGGSIDLVLAAAFAVQVGRHSGQHDVVVGWHADTWRPLRIELGAGTSFTDLLVELERQISGEAPGFDHLLRSAGAESIGGAHPLFQTGVRTGEGEQELASLLSGPDRASLDLVFDLCAYDDREEARLVYDARLYPAATIAAFARRLEHSLDPLLGNARHPVRTLDLLPPDETERICERWNSTAAEFSSDLCLHEIVEARAAANPDAVAVIRGEARASYGEINRRANRLAHHLRELGVGRNDRVGVALERSPDLVVAKLGILKAGGAYVPFDPDYPAERLRRMQDDAGLGALVTRSGWLERFSPAETQTVLLDEHRELLARASGENPTPLAEPGSLAYVIFTSGSTGRPKAIALDHRGRVNNFEDFNRRFSVAAGDRLLSVSALGFDMTAYDIFGTLMAGATLVMPPAEESLEPSAWARELGRHRVTVWHSVPQLLMMLVEHAARRSEPRLDSLRLVLLGGDWIPLSLPERLWSLAPEARFVSMGGATECSMDSTLFEVEQVEPEWKSIPYGRPMANQTAYVLDADGNLVPPGVAGELYLGGIGVAWGYLGQPRLTAERFLPHPYPRVPGERLYRTGDLARHAPDGNLELLGRADHQVKIRGHRVELGDVLSAVQSYPGVRDAVVTARGAPGEERTLVAYVVPDHEGARELERLQVDEWREIYEQTYGGEREVDPTFDIVGWNSSYTGLPIPAEQMREWVETTVARIAARRPRRVLEIGCGTGLLLFRIAPRCEAYVGIDFSLAALERVRETAGDLGLEQVELIHAAADDLEAVGDRSFDAVVLNSITQLFPSVDYLLTVLRAAVDRVEPGGFLFVGDNRSLPHLWLQHASLQLEQAPPGTPVDDFRARVDWSLEQEEQLCLDPTLFARLADVTPRVGALAIELERGRHVNELTKFRYDVMFEIEPDREPEEEPPRQRLDWKQDRFDEAQLLRLLEANEDREIVIADLPNARLWREARLRELIGDGAALTVEEMRRHLHTLATDGADPERLFALAASSDRALRVEWAASGDPTRIDACFGVPGRSRVAPRAASPTVAGEVEWSRLANRPLRARLDQAVPGKLRAYLAERLPEHMVPTHVVVLDELPLTPNGKVDRSALPEPGRRRPEIATPYVAPRDELERVIADLWQEVLTHRVGVRDSFLEMGGHSLLAAQIEARVHDLFQIEIPLSAFLGGTSVAAQAVELRRAGTEAGVDVDGIARAIVELGSWSDDELAAALERTEST